MTAATRLAGAVLSAFLLAGNAAEAGPAEKAPATPATEQQGEKQCKQEKDLTSAERRAVLRGVDVGLCKDDAQKKEKPAVSPAPGR